MSDEHLVTLPDRETMQDRLRAVNHEQDLQRYFYPKLVLEAGKMKQPMEVVMLLRVAIHSYVEDERPEVAIALMSRSDEFIDALILDEQAAANAKEFHKETLLT